MEDKKFTCASVSTTLSNIKLIGLRTLYRIVSLLIIVVILCGGPMHGATVHFDINPKPTVIEHGKIKLTCHVAAEQLKEDIKTFNHMQLTNGITTVLIYKAKKDEFELLNQWKGRTMDKKFDKTSMTLTVELEATREDSGQMTCEWFKTSYPTDDDDTKSTVFIRVMVTPVIQNLFVRLYKNTEPFPNQSTTFSDGDRVTSTCNGVATSPLTCKITMNGREISGGVSGEGTKINFIKNQSSVVNKVAHVTLTGKDHPAHFKCLMSNGAGTDTKELEVSVRHKAHFNWTYTSNSKLKVGTAIKCSAKGYPPPQVNITVVPLKNSTYSSTPRWTQHSKTGEYEVEKKIPMDAPFGFYGISCVAFNDFEANERSYDGSDMIRIEVVDAPFWTKIISKYKTIILGAGIPAGIIFIVIVVFICIKCH